MNFGFDLDKIFIDYPPFVPGKIIDRLYKNKSNGTLSYRIPSKPEQLFRRTTHYPIFRPPIMQNIQFLKTLPKNKKNKYYLISSRFLFLKTRTEEIIKKYSFEKIFDGMHFNFDNKQPHLFKDEVIKNMSIHKYIDDDLPLLQFLRKNNPQTVFFWLNKKNEKKLEENLFAITNIAKFFD